MDGIFVSYEKKMMHSHANERANLVSKSLSGQVLERIACF